MAAVAPPAPRQPRSPTVRRSALFEELADEHGGLDNGRERRRHPRQSYFARGTEEDWEALLSVHLGGYLNVLEAALPLMASAGHGRIVGVTSRGLGAATACRRVQLREAPWPQRGGWAATPPGVTVNALSPIANTRMVAAALERARQEGRAGGGGGLTLNSCRPRTARPPRRTWWTARSGWARSCSPAARCHRRPTPADGGRAHDGCRLAARAGRGVCSTCPRQGRGQAGERRGRQSPLRFDLRRAGARPHAAPATVYVVVVDERSPTGGTAPRRARSAVNLLSCTSTLVTGLTVPPPPCARSSTPRSRSMRSLSPWTGIVRRPPR